MTKQYGLLGRTLGHSFSRNYFTEKFKELSVDAEYRNFEIQEIASVRELLHIYPELAGFNVTIPYKSDIIPFLDEVEEMAATIGAVNTVLVDEGRMLGFNTDVIGFRDSLAQFYPEGPGGNALVLGTGGASKAVVYVLEHFFAFDRVDVVSRNPSGSLLGYEQLHETGIGDYRLIINTTPVGMVPHEKEELPLPWRTLRRGQYLYDLIYNPERTPFLQHGERHGCHTLNGMDMLIRQADAAWEIWSEE